METFILIIFVSDFSDNVMRTFFKLAFSSNYAR